MLPLFLFLTAVLPAGGDLPTGLPPADLMKLDGVYLEHPGSRFATDVQLGATIDQEVRVRSVQRDESGMAVRSASMTIGVAYFPTAITRISESEVAVAGRLEAGPSIIEKWTLGRPVYGETLVAGQYRRCLQVAPVLEQRVVLLRAEVGLDGVQGMTWMPGAFEPSLLVHFHDSKDLYRMRLRDGELVRVASPGSHRGVPEIPGLGAPFSHYAVRHHVERGYVYSFNMPGCTGTLERPWLVLADEDRDGVLDRERPMDDEVWEEWGFGSPQLWIDEVWSH